MSRLTSCTICGAGFLPCAGKANLYCSYGCRAQAQHRIAAGLTPYRPCFETGRVINTVCGKEVSYTPYEAEIVMAGFERMADRLHNTTLAAHFRADVQALGEALLRLRERAITSTVAGDAIERTLERQSFLQLTGGDHL
jgi:hypothetical protein